MKIGSHVEVKNRFDARWSKGFEVAEIDNAETAPTHDQAGPSRRCRIRVRRRSDNCVLPAWFEADDIREERRRETWWI